MFAGPMFIEYNNKVLRRLGSEQQQVYQVTIRISGSDDDEAGFDYTGPCQLLIDRVSLAYLYLIASLIIHLPRSGSICRDRCSD